MNAGKFALTLSAAIVVVFFVSFSHVNAADFTKEWTCTSGLSCGGDCQGNAYMGLNNNNYEFAFTADPGVYNCDMSVKNTWFAFSGETPELNEYSDVYLNDVKVGNTNDLFCNSVAPPPPCVTSVPSDVGGLSNPICFNEFSDSRFCRKGRVTFTLSNIPSWELDDAKTQRLAGYAVRYVFFALSNTKNRNMVVARFQYYPEEDKFIVKSAGATCASCECCDCAEDTWCGGELARSQCPELAEGTYKLRWDSDSRTVCMEKGSEGENCYTMKNGFAFNSYCLGIGCDGTVWHRVWQNKFSSSTVTLDSFSCESATTTAPQSCPGTSNGAVSNGLCGGGNGGGCDYDGSCESGETHANCPSDCECDYDSDCDVNEVCSNHVCVYSEVETHKECVADMCEEVPGAGADECFTDDDCEPIMPAGGSGPEGDRVYFGLGLDGYGKSESRKVEGTTLSFQTGCTYCGDVIKNIQVNRVQLQASNKIKLRAYQSHGLKSLSISCTMLQPPVADAGPDQSVNLTGPYAAVSFSGVGSQDPDGYIVEYRWNFSDGYYGYGISTTHNYYKEGIYVVMLNVTDNDGLKDTDTMTLRVNKIPTITDNYAYSNIWVNSDQTVTLTAQDDTGIKSVKYCNGAGCSPATGQTVSGPPYTISFTGDMNRVVRYRAWDVYDNPSQTGEFRVRIDKTPPVTTDSHDGVVHGDGYVVTLSCTDGGSGCYRTYYCITPNGTGTCTPMTVGTSVVVTCPAFSYCEKFIRYYSADSVGNAEPVRTSQKIKIDTRIPTCQMTPLNPYTTSGSIQLQWSGRDSGGSESGVTGYRVWYRKDAGSWAVWNDFSSTAKSGTYTGENGHSYSFRCQSQDSLSGWGSYSTPVSTFVDMTPPTASLDALPEWVNGNIFNVSWSGQDSGSGVRDYDVEYSTSPPGWSSWLSQTALTSRAFGDGDPLLVADGTVYHFRVRARDRADLAGNWSASDSTGVDLTIPACTITALPDYIKTSVFPVSWSGQDSGSGVRDYDVEYSSDGTTWILFISRTGTTSKNANLMDGVYHFRCRARDRAGNEGTWSASESVKVDTRAPGATVKYNSPVLGGNSITVKANLYDVSEITNVTLIYGETVVSEADRTETSANNWTVSWVFPVSEDYGSDEFIVVTEDIHANSRSFRYSFSIVVCEDGEFRDCGTNVGECRKGNQTCVEGMWGDCLGGLSERLEVCDGKDNDCDGEVDDGIICSCVPGAARECGIDTGECSKGTQTCTSEQVWGPCVNGFRGPEPEICDGKDNDCDGETDNGAQCCQEATQRPCGFSNVGICELGVSACRNGVWGDCRNAVMPEPYDTCDNGLDDDCDGETDEGCALCSNGEQDEEEEGIDCGGPCPPCSGFPWYVLSIIGVIILVVLVFLWKRMKAKGEELTWENMKKEWSR